MCIITNVPIMCEELLNQRSVSLLNLWFSAKCFLEHFVCLFVRFDDCNVCQSSIYV